MKKVSEWAGSKAEETKLKDFGKAIANREVYLEINGIEYYWPDPTEYKQADNILLIKVE